MSVALVGAIGRVVEGEDLTSKQMEAAMEAILAGEAAEAHIAALAVGLRMKGETATEIAAAAQVMRRRCIPVDIRIGADEVLVDTCGTGGDGAGTFNVSTVSAFAVAAAGVKVAKHGNRAVSSRSGSADVLEALGARLDLPAAHVAACVEEVGIGFLYAPAHHGALRHAAPVRRALGLRTFFNLLGPLSNPAAVTHQLVGVYDPDRVRQLAEVLGRLGLRGAWVVHGEGGLDEVSPLGSTRVAVLSHGEVTEREVSPSDFGLAVGGPESVAGGDAAQNAVIARRVLAGEPVPQRLPVVLNAAAALVAAGVESSPVAAAERIGACLDEGAALAVLEAFVAHGQAAP